MTEAQIRKTLLKASKMVTVGQKVICNGYDGAITKVCDGQLLGMCEVRLARGSVCVSISELLRFNREECRA